MVVDMKGSNFVVKEKEVRHFVDYCIDHMDSKDVTFKVPN